MIFPVYDDMKLVQHEVVWLEIGLLWEKEYFGLAEIKISRLCKNGNTKW
jgi:hypothetical protein